MTWRGICDAISGFRHRLHRHAAPLCWCVLPAFCGVAVADAERRHCDPGLKAVSDREVGYAERGDRCEGIYAQDVSGALQITSLTLSSANYRFSAEVPLVLQWPLASGTRVDLRSGTGVHLRASGLRRRLYYRMDTSRPAQPPAYKWPSDVLARLQLTRNEVGLLAWTEQPVAGEKRRIYLPLDVTPQPAAVAGSAAPAGEYKVVLLSTVELQEVYVSLRAIEADGRPGRTLRSAVSLDQGFYPAERPISFRIPHAELGGVGTGLFALSIGAELKNGDPRVAPEIIFLHVDRGR